MKTKAPLLVLMLLFAASLACGSDATPVAEQAAQAALRPTFTATEPTLPPTNTPISSTDTPVAPTDTLPPPTDTPIPSTDTPVAPTDTLPPPTDTTAPPTNTPAPTQPPTAAPAPQADVAIVDIYNAGYAEHVVIRNRAGAPADLSGWQLREEDASVEPFTFPAGFTLAPGAEVRIYSGRDDRQHNPPAAFSWTEKNVWDNDGETARLFDAQGNLASEYTYR